MQGSTENIIAACLKQNRKAQKELFDRYNLKLYAVVYNYMNDGEEAKEVLQRSWIEIFNSLSNYKEKDALEGWLKTIVIRQAWKANKQRTKVVDINSISHESADNSAARLMDSMTCQEILKEMELIPSAARMVFKLFVLDELSHSEIADQLGINRSTSRAHLAQARKIMRRRFISINKLVKDGI